MILALEILILIAGFVLLVWGADLFVGGACGIASRFGIPQLVIGMTVVALGTSAPEAAVSIAASVKGSADIAVGNVLGSNLINILIILAVAALIAPLSVAASTARIEIPFMIGVSVLFCLLGINQKIGLPDGLILMACLILYLFYLIRMSRKHSPKEPEFKNLTRLPRALLMTAIGLAMIIFGSSFAVDAAGEIARALGAGERLIGLTIVAFGTSLPELFTSAAAVRQGKVDIAIGNIVGSNIFNILFVIGLSALITPVPFSPEFFTDAILAVGAAVLLFACVQKRHRLSRASGGIFLICYAVYFIYTLFSGALMW